MAGWLVVAAGSGGRQRTWRRAQVEQRAGPGQEVVCPVKLNKLERGTRAVALQQGGSGGACMLGRLLAANQVTVAPPSTQPTCSLAR